MELDEKLEIGQWVQSWGASRIIDKCIGFIEFSEKDIHFVRFVKNNKGERIHRGSWVDAEDLIGLEPILAVEDIKTLIDMAIDMKDKEWFEELINSLKPQVMPW